jgi:hypothetical protein
MSTPRKRNVESGSGAVVQDLHNIDDQPSTHTQGSGVVESGTYANTALARSDHNSP